MPFRLRISRKFRRAIQRAYNARGTWFWLLHPRQEAGMLSLTRFYGKRGPWKATGTPEECALEFKRWVHRRGA